MSYNCAPEDRFAAVQDYFLKHQYEIVSPKTVSYKVNDPHFTPTYIVTELKHKGLTILSIRVIGHTDLEVSGYMCIPDKRDEWLNTDAIDQQLNLMEETNNHSESFFPLEIVRMAAARKSSSCASVNHLSPKPDIQLSKLTDEVTDFIETLIHNTLDTMVDRLDDTFDERIDDISLSNRCRAWTRQVKDKIYLDIQEQFKEKFAEIALKLSEKPMFIISTKH